MFCQKCGKEIDDNARFCANCGSELSTVNKNEFAVLRSLGLDIKEVTKKFFSKNPSSIMETSNNHKSKIGLVFILINALLFGFTTCLNVVQIANYWLGNVVSNSKAVLEDLLGNIVTSYLSDEISSSISEVPISFELFWPLMLMALIISAIVICLVYILLKVEKKPLKPFSSVSNCVGLASYPMIVALTVNLIVGLIIPYLTIFFFVMGILISLIYLYEGLKNIFEVEKPIIRSAIIFMAILIVITIAISIGLNAIEEAILDAISSGTGSVLGELIKSSF